MILTEIFKLKSPLPVFQDFEEFEFVWSDSFLHLEYAKTKDSVSSFWSQVKRLCKFQSYHSELECLTNTPRISAKELVHD